MKQPELPVGSESYLDAMAAKAAGDLTTARNLLRETLGEYVTAGRPRPSEVRGLAWVAREELVEVMERLADLAEEAGNAKEAEIKRILAEVNRGPFGVGEDQDEADLLLADPESWSGDLFPDLPTFVVLDEAGHSRF
jgi:hypothetical protein